MKQTLACLRTFTFGAAMIVSAATAAQAQAVRTWVSGVGDDANPCSRTAPCKTFQGALSRTAVGGFIDVLDAGGFGNVTITRSITIDGSGGPLAGVLSSPGANAIIINSSTAVVHLRNLSIESPIGSPVAPGLNGIEVIAAAKVHVEKCVISGFSANAINFHPPNAQLFVTDTSLYDNAGGGVVVQTGRATVENLHADGNGNGVVVNGNAIATVRNSYAAGGSTGFGAVVSQMGVINIENSTATNNTFGILVNGGATARVSDTMVVSNSTAGLQNDGISFIVSLQGNEVTGNVTDGVFTSTVIKQ